MAMSSLSQRVVEHGRGAHTRVQARVIAYSKVDAARWPYGEARFDLGAGIQMAVGAIQLCKEWAGSHASVPTRASSSSLMRNYYKNVAIILVRKTHMTLNEREETFDLSIFTLPRMVRFVQQRSAL